jgi:hypothetical protein
VLYALENYEVTNHICGVRMLPLSMVRKKASKIKLKSDKMKKPSERTAAKGGWVKSDSTSGRFVEVGTSKGVTKSSPKSESSVREASSKRSSALKRLADR